MGEQLLRGKVSRMAALDDCPGDVGSQVDQPQHSGKIGACQACRLRKIGKTFAAALGQLVAEVMSTGDQLAQLWVGL